MDGMDYMGGMDYMDGMDYSRSRKFLRLFKSKSKSKSGSLSGSRSTPAAVYVGQVPCLLDFDPDFDFDFDREEAFENGSIWTGGRNAVWEQACLGVVAVEGLEPPTQRI
jgi:hypothetical protein